MTVLFEMDFRKMDGNDLVSEKTITNLIKLRRGIENFEQSRNSDNRKIQMAEKFGKSKISNNRKIREIKNLEQPKNSKMRNFRMTTKFGQTFSLLTFFIFP